MENPQVQEKRCRNTKEKTMMFRCKVKTNYKLYMTVGSSWYKIITIMIYCRFPGMPYSSILVPILHHFHHHRPRHHQLLHQHDQYHHHHKNCQDHDNLDFWVSWDPSMIFPNIHQHDHQNYHQRSPKWRWSSSPSFPPHHHQYPLSPPPSRPSPKFSIVLQSYTFSTKHANNAIIIIITLQSF